MADSFEYTISVSKNSTVGYDAVFLALTRSIKDENSLKELYTKLGKRFVVTEIGGRSNDDFQVKVNRSVMGASLNAGLIEKTSRDIHALLHATEEAKRGILINTSSTTNLALKMAIVRDDEWIAVAIFGESSIHPVTGHERCGLGIMHL